MKPLFRALKKWIKRYLLEEADKDQAYIVNLLSSKIKTPVSDELEKQILNEIYDGLQDVITHLVEKV